MNDKGDWSTCVNGSRGTLNVKCTKTKDDFTVAECL